MAQFDIAKFISILQNADQTFRVKCVYCPKAKQPRWTRVRKINYQLIYQHVTNCHERFLPHAVTFEEIENAVRLNYVLKYICYNTYLIFKYV